MNIVKTINQYNADFVFFCAPIKNSIMNDSNFIRIIYSNSSLTLNGIYIYIMINHDTIEKHYNKYKFNFNINTHQQLINQLRDIEHNLLKNVKIYNKIPQFKIMEQLSHGYLKIFIDDDSTNRNNNNDKNDNNNYILKISGIWETTTHYGITYRIVRINHLL